MPRGRPPKWKSAEAMQEVIDAYFKNCKGRLLIGEDGRIATDKQGAQIIVGARPPTVTGLALARGKNSFEMI